ncbi:hypothetical protein Tco_0612543 [Tanacetum coccineum]
MVTVPIHQASSSVPLLSTPVIDLSPLKPVSPPVQELVITAITATTTTTTLPLPPPPQQQSTTDPELASHVSTPKKICANFEKRHKLQDETIQACLSRLYKLDNHGLYSKIDKQVNEVVKEAVYDALQALILECFKELSEVKMKEILHDQIFKSGSYKSHPNHRSLYEALEVSMDSDNKEEFVEAKDRYHKRSRNDKDPTPPPPKDLDQSKKKRHDYYASAPKQPTVQTSSAWKTSNTREAPSSSSKQKSATQYTHPVDDIPTPDDVHLSDSQDTGAAHLPKIKTRQDWLKLIPEEKAPKTPDLDRVIPPNDLPDAENNSADAIAKMYKDLEEYKILQKTRDMSFFIYWYCKQIGKKKLFKADLEGHAYKIVQPFQKNIIQLQFQMEECHLLLTDQIDLINPEGNRFVPNISKLLPLGGPPGQVIIQSQYFFNRDLEYLISGDKERRHALSISKMKATYFTDFGLEELVLSLWIKSKRDYDISAAYGISHWWFKRKEFYIKRHSAPSDHSEVRSHMRILNIVSLKTYSRYGYTYWRKIVLRRANYKEYKISKSNFKNLHPNDFEDMYLLHLQGKLNHFSGSDKVHLFKVVNLWIRNIIIRQRVEDLQLGVKSYQTKLNLTQPNWDASDFLFKEDYTIVHKQRVVIYKDKNYQKKMIQETEVHKFSDGTLTRILEKLDHMVKDFKIFKFNPGMEYMIWSEDDKRRSEEFIKLIERRLKIRRIFRNLESFVSGCIRDIDYTLIQRT